MATSIQVMTADAMRLAATQYNDSTAFVTIMQLNGLTDYLINEPVIVTTAAPASMGDQSLIFASTSGIELGDYIYCAGYNSFGVVTSVTQNYSTPAIADCSCPSQSENNAILPPQGQIVSTGVTVSPPLDNDLLLGSTVTFAVSDVTIIQFPNPVLPSADGVPQ